MFTKERKTEKTGWLNERGEQTFEVKLGHNMLPEKKRRK